MVNENFIPKVEEIREIKTEIPTYEEFMKTYQSDKAVINGFESEINSLERGYGPMYNSSTSFTNRNPLITFAYGRNNFNNYQFEISGSYYEYTNVLKIYNLSDARNYLRRLERGEIKIVDALNNYKRSTYEEQAVKGNLQVDIEKIERGEINSVKYDWSGCTRNCLYESYV